MKTNKTPIQELIDWLDEQSSYPRNNIIERYNNMKSIIESLEPKEKQFAFDCFEAGYKARHYFSAGDGDYAFEQFYSQHVTQHNK